MHTLEVQKVSSDEEIRRLVDLVNAQKEELALLKGDVSPEGLQKIHESYEIHNDSDTAPESDDDSLCYSPRDSPREASVPHRGVSVGGRAPSVPGPGKEKKAKKAKKEKKEKKRLCVEDEVRKEKKKKKTRPHFAPNDVVDMFCSFRRDVFLLIFIVKKSSTDL